MTIALIGVGNMGSALLAGWLAAGTSPEDIVAVDRSEESCERVVRDYGIRCVELDEATCADVIVLAVKPHQCDEVLAQLSLGPDALLLSIAAGITIARLEKVLEGAAVVRAMPNTAALVGKSITGIVPGSEVDEARLQQACNLMGAVGKTLVTDEAHIDALTGISGSGPAYLFAIADAMIEAGVHQGLTRADAHKLTVQTFVGAAAMLDESSRSAVELREQVTSPAGTTAAALRVLDERGVRAAMMAAVEACVERSREIAADH